jgi:membrane-associated phospholipid phosphatase
MRLWRESLIHERIFGAYVAFTLARLIFAVGFSSPHTLLYMASLAFIAAGVLFTRRRASVWTWRARLAIYPILMNVMFVNMRWVSPLINDGKKDALLWELDRRLVGGSLSAALEPWISPPLTELMCFCYMFFMVYLAIGILTYLFSDVSLARTFYAGLFSLYGAGYFGYTLMPAIGPYLAYASQFSVPLNGYFMTDFLEASYASGTNFTDIFPSLHCAVSFYLLFFDLKRSRRRFAVCLLPCIGIWFSTIYLRYHYFVDVLAGFALGAAALATARFASRREELPPGKTKRGGHV